MPRLIFFINVVTELNCEVLYLSLSSAHVIKIKCEIVNQNFSFIHIFRFYDKSTNDSFLCVLDNLLKDDRSGNLIFLIDINLYILQESVFTGN